MRVGFATPDDVADIQSIWHQPHTVGALGGPSFREVLNKSCERNAVVATWDGDKMTSFLEFTYRPYIRISQNNMGVDKEYQSLGLVQAMMTMMVIECASTFRWEIVDHLIGNNPGAQLSAMGMGYQRKVTMRKKTRRHQTLSEWTLNLLEKSPGSLKWVVESLEEHKFEYLPYKQAQLPHELVSRLSYEQLRQLAANEDWAIRLKESA